MCAGKEHAGPIPETQGGEPWVGHPVLHRATDDACTGPSDGPARSKGSAEERSICDGARPGQAWNVTVISDHGT